MTRLAPGNRAPAFTLPDLFGRPVQFDPASPGFKLLAFYKENCPTCRFALPYFDRLYATHQGERITAFAVAQEESATAAAVARDLDLKMPQFLDQNPFGVSRAYGIFSVPTLILIDADARLLRISPAFVRADLLEIAATLDGRQRNAQCLFRPEEPIPELRAG